MSTRKDRSARSAQAYIVPQRRATAAGGSVAHPRGLGDLEHGCLKLLLLYSDHGPFACTECPFKMVPVPKGEIDKFDTTLQNMVLESDCDTCSYINLPKLLAMEDGAEEILRWYKSTSQILGTGDTPMKDTRAQLALPACLSSDERSRWHQLCRTVGVYSSSKGLGEHRRLLIGLAPAMATDGNGKWAHRDQSIANVASETHELLCEAHGGHSPYSFSELEEMLIERVDLPPDIVKLKAINPFRQESMELWQSLTNKNQAAALELLRTTEYPREISCRKNSDRTKYPIHAAVADGMMDVVTELANPDRYAGVFSQRDGQGRTALSMACNSMLVDCVVLFMTAGAPDPSGDVDALHRELIRSGDRSRRQVLNSCKYTTAFRRELNPKCKLVNGHATTSGEAQTSDGQSDLSKGAPSRRRLASSGMHALGRLLASDAAVLAKGGTTAPTTIRDDPSHRPAQPSLKTQPKPGPRSTPKQFEQIPFRKQRGRGRFTAKGDGASKAQMDSDEHW